MVRKNLENLRTEKQERAKWYVKAGKIYVLKNRKGKNGT